MLFNANTNAYLLARIKVVSVPFIDMNKSRLNVEVIQGVGFLERHNKVKYVGNEMLVFTSKINSKKSETLVLKLTLGGIDFYDYFSSVTVTGGELLSTRGNEFVISTRINYPVQIQPILKNYKWKYILPRNANDQYEIITEQGDSCFYEYESEDEFTVTFLSKDTISIKEFSRSNTLLRITKASGLVCDIDLPLPDYKKFSQYNNEKYLDILINEL